MPFDINIIQAYAPTSDHSDDETEVFYEEMKQAMSYVKCGEVVIAMGDFNAKVGYGEHLDIIGQFGLGSRNERGSRLLQFCEENNMIIANTYQSADCIRGEVRETFTEIKSTSSLPMRYSRMQLSKHARIPELMWAQTITH